MALSEANVRVAVTGAVYKAPLETAAPTGTASALTGRTDLGYMSEDGVTLSLAGQGDSTPIKAWQNGATVRTIRTASEENPTLAFTMIETKRESVELYFNTTVTQSSTEGTFDYDSTAVRESFDYVLDILDGGEIIRMHAPRVIATEVGDQVYSNGEPIGYEVTMEMEKDPVAGYNFRCWSTALKS